MPGRAHHRHYLLLIGGLPAAESFTMSSPRQVIKPGRDVSERSSVPRALFCQMMDTGAALRLDE